MSASPVGAQVTTATLVGQLRDSSGAVIPGATVVATHEGTGVTRDAVTDVNGEFVLSALPNGPYTVKIELTGFKTLENRGMQLGAGQTVRQTFALEVGTFAETVTVAVETPLIETSASLQADSLGSQEVRELPVNRRNLTNLMSLTPGVSTSGAGDVQMNGVAAGGTGVTVDGTEANSNPEARSLAQYGGQNQISVMSLDSIAEVQIVKGVLPAEYGGVAGGQINVISRSGTNTFHGSAFYSGQNEKLNARSFFSSAQQPVGTFNQYGGTLGGPILRNKAFFFATYEGYHENVQQNLNMVVPYKEVRDEILRALPFPETTTVLEVLPLPTEPIVSSQGVVDPQIGRWRGLGTRKRTENAPRDQGRSRDLQRGQPRRHLHAAAALHLEPRAVLDNANDREYPNEQDRVAAQMVMTRGRWVSESRVGWNRTYLARLDAFLSVMGPNAPPEILPYGRRMPAFSISNLFATPRSEIWDMKGITYSFEQKLSRSFQRHLVKAGFRFMRETGGRLNPENPSFTYQTYADLLANIPQSLSTSFGAPPHDSTHGSIQRFIQDDWRLGDRFVLNLGLRVRLLRTGQGPGDDGRPRGDRQLRSAHRSAQMDFGPLRDPLRPYEPDGNNLGPRAGFAWTLDQHQRTVVRGGVGMLYSPHLVATVRQSAANPFIPFRIVYNRTEIAAGRSSGRYTPTSPCRSRWRTRGQTKRLLVVRPEHAGSLYHSVDGQRPALVRSDAGRRGWLPAHRRSRLPLQRQFTQAFDRETGARPNPALGAPGGYYIDSSQTMVYNGLQTSVRKRFKNSYSWEVNYTLGKSEATQGGDLSAYYIASSAANFEINQDFWDPEFDRGPASNDVRHRLNGSFIVELPGIPSHRVLNAVLGGWQLSGIAQMAIRLGAASPAAIGDRPQPARRRPRRRTGILRLAGPLRCQRLHVPESGRLRQGSRESRHQRHASSRHLHDGYGPRPSSTNVHMTLSKNFTITQGMRMQVRAEAFNVLNMKNYNNPELRINNSEFGRISGAGGSRRFQFSGRLTF